MTYNINIRGVRASLPQGTIMGRPANAGSGPAVPLSAADLRGLGIPTNSSVGQAVANSALVTQEAGTTLGPTTTLNFTGAGQTATIAGKVTTVNIPGSTASGPLAACTAQISAGSAVLLYQTNVASITYTAVGRYRITFTSAIQANAGLAFAGRFPTEVGPVMPIINIDSTSGYGLTTTYVDVAVETAAGVIADLSFLSVYVFNPGTAVTGFLLDTFGIAATGAYSTRKLRTGATKALQVTRTSDNTTMDIGFVSGQLDTATLTTFVGSNTGYVSIWYDQSGNGNDLSQVTGSLGNCPRIVDSGTLCVNANNTPSVKFPAGSSSQLSNASASLLATAFTIGIAFQPLATSAIMDLVYTFKSSAFGVGIGPGVDSSGKICLENGGWANVVYTSGTALTLGSRYAFAFTSAAGITVGTTGPLVMTGYQANTSLGSASLSSYAATLAGFGVGNSGDTTQGYIPELILFGSVLDSAHLTTLYNSQAAL